MGMFAISRVEILGVINFVALGPDSGGSLVDQAAIAGNPSEFWKRGVRARPGAFAQRASFDDDGLRSAILRDLNLIGRKHDCCVMLIGTNVIARRFNIYQ